MFKKRRSMLGRRHLMTQQNASTRPVQQLDSGDGSNNSGGGSGRRRGTSSWRGSRSEKKKASSYNQDKASKDFKKCLFSKSPGFNYMAQYRTQSQDRNQHSSANDNFLNETGINIIAPTPRSTPRITITPGTLQRRRIDLERNRYGPSSARSITRLGYESDKSCPSSSSTTSSQRSYCSEYLQAHNDLKPPVSPGPSKLERFLLEEKLAQKPSSTDFYNLNPPDSPGPSKLEKLLEEEYAQTTSNGDLYNLKPPDSPGPSKLERFIFEEKLAQTSSSSNFYDLKPPDSPGPSKLEKLLKDELVPTSSSSGFCNQQPSEAHIPLSLDKSVKEVKLECASVPELKNMQSLSLDDPKQKLKFSPPLSSTYIGSPDSGKKNTKVKETVTGSGTKLSTIREDCDVSVIEREDCNVSIIEFEQNERTIQELEDTLVESTMNNTVMPNHVSRMENIPEEHYNKCSEEIELSWETILSRLDIMERAVADTALFHVNQLKTLQEKIEKESLENVRNIRLIKKSLESLRQPNLHECSIENKENNSAFKVPATKKKQMAKESNWFNSVKKGNPGLLKTPNARRKKTSSVLLTPHSLSNVLHDQLNELYDV